MCSDVIRAVEEHKIIVIVRGVSSENLFRLRRQCMRVEYSCLKLHTVLTGL